MPVPGSSEDGKVTGDFAEFDLLREIADSEGKKPWSAGIHARVLTKKPDFRVVLISMETAARLKEHRVDRTSSVQVLKGASGTAQAGRPMICKLEVSLLSLPRSRTRSNRWTNPHSC
jgi:hypothetical protein